MAIPKNYYNFFDICKMEGIPEGTAKRACANGLDGQQGIKSLEALKPIGHLFRRFEKITRKGPLNQYGVLRRHYDFWKRTGEAPKVSSGRPPKWKGNPNIFNLNIPFPKDLWGQFKQVVDTANSMSIAKVTYRDMVAVAVQEFIDRRPQLLDGDK